MDSDKRIIITLTHKKDSPVTIALSKNSHFASRVHRQIAYLLDPEREILKDKRYPGNLNYEGYIQIEECHIVGFFKSIEYEELADDMVATTLNIDVNPWYVEDNVSVIHPRLLYNVNIASDPIVICFDVEREQEPEITSQTELSLPKPPQSLEETLTEKADDTVEIEELEIEELEIAGNNSDAWLARNMVPYRKKLMKV